MNFAPLRSASPNWLQVIVCIAFAFALTACSNESTTEHSSQTNAKGKHQAAIASAHPLATQAGMEILNAGGNAFDAAVATAAVLAVVEPYSAGMGGGGFWLLHDAKQNKNIFVDARETAPLKAHRDMYLDDDGEVIDKLSINGPMAAAIPGQAAAFVHLAERYGKLPLRETLKAAIDIADKGFPVDPYYRKLAGFRLQAMRLYPETSRIFLGDNKQIPAEGYLVKQPELSATLQAIADKGFAGFYSGQVAIQLVNAVQAAGGIWTLDDLAQYQVIEREPVTTQFDGYRIISAPPPSSGGLAIAQMMNMLTALEQTQQLDWRTLDSVSQTHVISEVMRRAYRDRALYLGDPDFVSIPTGTLLDATYAKDFIGSFNMNKATPSNTLGDPVGVTEGFHTTHLSVLDGQGNRVSATLSINLPFGSAFTAKGTGVLLNNEMDDFSSKPGTPNAYGLVGNEANAIAPKKRPLSSMSPSFVESDSGVAILGTPGGSRIITMVMLGMLEHMQNQPVQKWVARKRFHHQYLPDVIQHEPNTFSDEEKSALINKGHTLKDVGRQYGNMHAIHWDRSTNTVTAASDPRGIGEALVE